MNTDLLMKMREAYFTLQTKVLTLNAVKELKGKRIQILYFGYRGQDGVDDFVVGEVREIPWNTHGETAIRTLYTRDGRDTYIHNHFMLSDNQHVFTCSDSDREVFYIVV